MPFTYFLTWTSLDKHYYGVRYAQGCQPSDLMTTYFTSSNHVKRFIESYGLPDKVEVDRVFDTIDEARSWETAQLIALDAVKSHRFLNRTNNTSINPRVAGHGKGKTYEEIMGESKAKKLRELRSRHNYERHSNPGYSERIGAKSSKTLTGRRLGKNNPRAKSVILEFRGEIMKFSTWKEAASFLNVKQSNFSAFVSAFENQRKRGSRCPILSQVTIISTQQS